MKEFMRKRQAVQDVIEEASGRMRQIDSDIRLTAEGKEEQKAPIRAKATELLEGVLTNTQQELQSKQERASELQVEVSKVDPAEVASKAAVMTPALVSMDYDGLLRLYESRSSEPAERALIEQVAMLKIDADKESPQKQIFIEQFGRASQNVYKSLPGHDKFEKAQGEADYLQSLNNVLSCQLREWQGGGIEGVEKIQLRRDLFALEQYEQALT